MSAARDLNDPHDPVDARAAPIASDLRKQWHRWRDRLVDKGLLTGDGAGLSLRIPGSTARWYGAADDETPRHLNGASNDAGARASTDALHAAVLAAREDVCAIAVGGGRFGSMLGAFGGAMPGVFDEQVRHLGLMSPPVAMADDLEGRDGLDGLAAALARGGNVLIVGGRPVVLGTTPMRLALNAELFEKCATAYVLAAATGGPVRPLPWIVRHVANGRLLKDERRARERVRAGLLPEEAKGY